MDMLKLVNRAAISDFDCPNSSVPMGLKSKKSVTPKSANKIKKIPSLVNF